MKTWLIDLCLVLAEWLGWTPPDVPGFLRRIRSLEETTQEQTARQMTAEAEITRLRARTYAPSVPTPFVTRAADLTTTVNPGFGGEAKRHQVYARLIKDFPDAPKRDLSMAIELALFQSPKEG